jgi:hypothetical protein
MIAGGGLHEETSILVSRRFCRGLHSKISSRALQNLPQHFKLIVPQPKMAAMVAVGLPPPLVEGVAISSDA